MSRYQSDEEKITAAAAAFYEASSQEARQMFSERERKEFARERAENELEIRRHRAHIFSCWLFVLGGLLLLWIISH